MRGCSILWAIGETCHKPQLCLRPGMSKSNRKFDLLDFQKRNLLWCQFSQADEAFWGIESSSFWHLLGIFLHIFSAILFCNLWSHQQEAEMQTHRRMSQAGDGNGSMSGTSRLKVRPLMLLLHRSRRRLTSCNLCHACRFYHTETLLAVGNREYSLSFLKVPQYVSGCSCAFRSSD